MPARAGTNRITSNGRIGTARASAGAYRLTLRTVGADGQRTTALAALRLRRR